MKDKTVDIINEEIKSYFGNRYYDEYARNPVTASEFNKTWDLILKCIELSKEKAL